MERIKLTKNEKRSLRLLTRVGWCPDTYPFHRFALGVEGLQDKGLVMAAWASGHELVSAELTDRGEAYLALNPTLRNPVDWHKIGVIAAIIAAIASAAALFVACQIVTKS